MRACLVSVLLVLVASARADVVGPESAGAAKAHYVAGVHDYQAANYVGALHEFNKSFELSKRPELLWNIGMCHERLGRFESALDAFQQYLDQHGTTANREEAEAKIAELRRILRQRSDIAGTQQASMPVLLPLAAWADPATEAPRSWGDRHRVGLSLSTIGAASLLAALGTGLGANHLAEELDARCPANQCAPSDRADIDRAHALAVSSDILLGVGIAAAVGGVIAFIVETRRRPVRVHATAASWSVAF